MSIFFCERQRLKMNMVIIQSLLDFTIDWLMSHKSAIVCNHHLFVTMTKLIKSQWNFKLYDIKFQIIF